MALWLFLGVALLMLFVGWLAGRKSNDEDFNIYGRKLPKWLYSATFAASYMGAGFFLVATAFIYQYGWGFAFFIGGLVIGQFIFGVFSHWLRKQKGKHYTLPEYYRKKFGKSSALLLACLQIIILAGDIAIQLVSGGKIMSELGVAPLWASIILTSVIILLYLMISGFRAVVWTDLVLLGGMFIILFLLTGKAALTLSAGWPLTETVTISAALAFLIFGIFGPFGNSLYFQRIFAAKSEDDAKHGTWIAAFWVAFAACCVFAVGMAARSIAPGIDPDLAFFAVISSYGHWFLYLGSLLIWACLMSTADTYSFAASQVLAQDILKKKLTPSIIRLSLIPVLLVGLLLAFTTPSLIELSAIFLGGSMVIAAPSFFQWFRTFTNRAVTIALLTGIICCALYIFFVAFDPAVVIVGLITTSIGLWLTTGIEFLLKKRARKNA